jgi:hypothetical protein
VVKAGDVRLADRSLRRWFQVKRTLHGICYGHIVNHIMPQDHRGYSAGRARRPVCGAGEGLRRGGLHQGDHHQTSSHDAMHECHCVPLTLFVYSAFAAGGGHGERCGPAGVG